MTVDDMVWYAVPAAARGLAAKAAAVLAAGPQVPADAPRVWVLPDRGVAVPGAHPPPGFGAEAVVPVKTASGWLKPVTDAFQFTPNRFNALFGGPTPVAGMLAGGLVGAGLGYAGGAATERILGDKTLEPGRLRKVLGLAGGLAGVAPAAYLGAVGARLNAADGKPALKAFVEPNVLLGTEGAEKAAEDEDVAGGLFEDSIPVDAFNRVVWADPNTPPGVRAATAGLVDGASHLRGGAQFVSPFDVGRIAAGMGSGLASGMLVGKTLGTLAGLTPGAQSVLQQTGMWAGALLNVVPRAFGF